MDIYQGAVAALVPFFVTERAYTYAAASGIVLAASLLSSVAQPLFGALTDRWAMPWLQPVSTMLVLPALVGVSVTLPVLRAIADRQPSQTGESSSPDVPDDVGSFVTLALAVVFRSIAFVGLSTFIALYIQRRLGGWTGTGTVA